MTKRFSLPLLALVLAPAPALAQSANDFQLPSAPSPTATPQAQGPVDTEGPLQIRPKVIATGTPTPSPTPTPSTVVTPGPIRTPAPIAPGAAAGEAQPRTAPSQRSRQTPRRTVPAETTPAGRSPVPPIEREPLPSQTEAAAPQPQPSSAVPTGNPGTSAAMPAREEDSAFPWIWIAALLGGLAALAAGFAWWRRRAASRPAPVIEPPLARDAEASAPPPADALSLRVEAIKLSRSVMNASLAYRVTVLNRSKTPLADVSVEADLVSANGERPMEDQVAGPAKPLDLRHQSPRLAAGQSARFEGQVQLPLAGASLVWQGRNALLVPLLRLRVTADGADPLAKTFVIGQSAPGASRLQPFSLQDGPRSYEPIAQRALD